MKLLRLLAIGAASSGLMLAAGGCGSDLHAPSAVATVAGTPINDANLRHWLSLQRATSKRASTDQVNRRSVLDLLIRWEWVEREARARHIRVPAMEAAKQLELAEFNSASGHTFTWLPEERSLEVFLTSPDVSRADRVALVTRALERLHLEEALVPKRLVSAYYTSHRGDFRISERRDIAAVMNPSEQKVLAAKREMEAHVPFSIVAERFNRSIEGGLRLGRAPGSQVKQYEKDFFSAPLHRLIGPRHERLYYVFEVFHITPGYERPLTRAAPRIRRLLLRRGAARSYIRAFERSWRSRTVCDGAYRSSECGQSTK